MKSVKGKIILIRLVSVLLMAFMVATTLSGAVFAGSDPLDTTQFNNHGVAGEAQTSVTNIIGAIITIVQVIGVGVAVIMLTVLAIKYISAAPSEKAEIKKSVTIYVVGAIVLFSASALLGIVKNFATNNIGK